MSSEVIPFHLPFPVQVVKLLSLVFLRCCRNILECLVAARLRMGKLPSADLLNKYQYAYLCTHLCMHCSLQLYNYRQNLVPLFRVICLPVHMSVFSFHRGSFYLP